MVNIIVILTLLLWPFIEHFLLIDFGKGYPDVNILRALIAYALMATILRFLTSVNKLHFDTFVKIFICFSVYIILNSLIQFGKSVHQLQHLLDVYIFPALFYYILINLKNSESENFKTHVVVSILLSGVIISLLGISETIYGNNLFGTTPGKGLVEWGYYRSSGPFSDGISYAGILLFFLPISWFAYKEKVIGRKFFSFVFVITSLASILHLSRACWLVFLFIFIVIFNKNKKLILSIIFCISFGATIFYFNSSLMDSIKSSDVYADRLSDATTMIGRYELYKQLYTKFFENPFIGIGFNKLSFELHPHNSYLQIMIELGLFGFLFWIFLIYSPLFVVYRISKKNMYTVFDSHDLKKVIICFFMIIFFIPNTIAAFNGYAIMFQYLIAITAIQYILSIKTYYKEEER